MSFPASPFTLDAFRRDTSGWSPIETSDHQRAWNNGAGDIAVQAIVWEPPQLPAGWHNNDVLRAAEGASPSEDAALVSAEVVHIAKTVSIQYILKQFMPEPSLGHCYLGVTMVAFRDFSSGVTFMAPELVA